MWNYYNFFSFFFTKINSSIERSYQLTNSKSQNRNNILPIFAHIKTNSFYIFFHNWGAVIVYGGGTVQIAHTQNYYYGCPSGGPLLATMALLTSLWKKYKAN